MGRLLAISGGVVWLLSIGLIAFAVHWSARPRVPPLAAVPTLLRELSAARASQFKEGEAWVVTKVTSAHHVLLVNIDAERVGNAQTIAAEIVAPVKERGFDEILVYVWRTHKHKPFADRRVQWTPKDGYTELVMGD
ncbi:MAG TPA: hypothetical protein VNZ24_11555 [Vicinamibacterales bacterium]|nr:hypothetical protein [Vicinamibacterales bacterium]